MGKLSRTKGAGEERRVARLYADSMDRDVVRNLDQYQKTSGRDLNGCQPYCVQIKVGKRVNYRQALDEAMDGMGNGYAYPVAHVRQDNKAAAVIMPESMWMTIVEILTTNKLFL